MSASEPHVFEFGEFRVETSQRCLLQKGEVVALTPKVFDTLLHLLEHRGEIVEKDDLMRAISTDTMSGGEQPQPEHFNAAARAGPESKRESLHSYCSG